MPYMAETEDEKKKKEEAAAAAKPASSAGEQKQAMKPEGTTTPAANQGTAPNVREAPGQLRRNQSVTDNTEKPKVAAAQSLSDPATYVKSEFGLGAIPYLRKLNAMDDAGKAAFSKELFALPVADRPAFIQSRLK